MASRYKCRSHLLGCQHGTDGEAVSQGLGEGHDVGSHPFLFVGEQGPCASHSHLDFVKNEKQVMLETKLFQTRQVAGSRKADPPVPPWMGSTRIAQVLGVTAASTAGTELNSTKLNPSTRGSNPLRTFS